MPNKRRPQGDVCDRCLWQMKGAKRSGSNWQEAYGEGISDRMVRSSHANCRTALVIKKKED